MISSLQAAPEFPNGSLVMDDEATEIISDWVQQIFNVARLKHLQPQLYIIADPEINAAAIPGGGLIIHTGLLLEAKHAGQFLGVLAHEVGHIAGGHRSPVDAALQEALVPAAIALLIGGLTAIIAQDPTALVAGFMGGSHVVERTLLSFSRHQESSADQAAFIYLQKLNWPAQGFLELFQTIHRKSTLMQKTVNRYATTHPLPPERIQATQDYLRQSKQPAAFPPKIEADFQRLKAKFTGFLSPPTQVLKLYPEKDASQAAQYARAIAYYRQGDHERSLTCMDTLLKASPTDPYFHELKGQILFDAGKTMAAISCLKTALQIVKKSPLIEILLAQALLESGKKEHIAEAMKRLVPLSQQKEPNIFIWRLMAMGYGHQKNPGMVALCLAEEAVLKKEFSFARIQVLKAKKHLAPTSPGFLRANDLLRHIADH